ncbi:hypothetical protein IWW51_000611 [Coemansia sp. RSA 2702]|nr:hypothetical protein IWW54_001771 [Coemansia sp. RSA 2705]KAJ2319515.1 hypothetical protein IWW52_001924 [Coemansia sp. RSA 2704]KAJ2329427.1 hypothetical protein IWW51_000611 [Coemansia sp. RSA 2702]KAJ2739605.1 hypothetical protein H4R23_000337 [Coemansia sp. Cherry 401B]
MATVNFWFEFASPYSMVAALRLLRALTGRTSPNAEVLQGLGSCQLPDLSGVHIVYRPVFLGAVFKAIGQQAMPNVQVPAKGKYLFHDVERTLNLLGCPGFPNKQPKHWPPNTALAGRMAWMLSQGPGYVCALDCADTSQSPARLQPAALKVLAEFVWRVYEAEFIASEDIGSPEVMARIWNVYVARSQLGDHAMPGGVRAVELAGSEAVKSGFKGSTQAAIDCKLFGAPSFTTEDGDMYWGNDHLLDACVHHRIRSLLNQPAGYCSGFGANI